MCSGLPTGGGRAATEQQTSSIDGAAPGAFSPPWLLRYIWDTLPGIAPDSFNDQPSNEAGEVNIHPHVIVRRRSKQNIIS